MRGRGHSAALPGPFGFDTHAADLRRVSLALGLNRPVLIGHSLGAHPALTDWSSDLEDYVRYDLTGEPGALRSRVNPDAVTADSRELLTAGDWIAAALRRLDGPTPLLRAPAGMFGQPPGLIPEELAAHWRDAAPALRVSTIPGTNHYSVLMAPHAAVTIAAHLAAGPTAGGNRDREAGATVRSEELFRGRRKARCSVPGT